MATVASSKETRKLYQQIDRVWYAIAILICGLALLDLKQVLPTMDYHRCVAGDCALYSPCCDGHWVSKGNGR